mmetsp:Transcript_78321/g.227210  ORF Transcript_78321/g.227210 Transcript_78321/m.227210 type:complete len:247 (-) Transcript_78321:454-1194(-)
MCRLALAGLEELSYKDLLVPNIALRLCCREPRRVETPVQGQLVQPRPSLLRRLTQNLKDLLDICLRGLVRVVRVASEERLPPARAAQQHLCENATSGPYIQRRTVAPVAKEQLDRPVGQRHDHVRVLEIPSGDEPELVVLTESHSRDTEVADLDFSRLVEQDVLGGKVAMQDAVLVQARGGVQHLPDDVLYLAERQVMPLRVDELEQGCLAELHHDEGVAVRRVSHLQDLNNVRVTYSLKDANLTE